MRIFAIAASAALGLMLMLGSASAIAGPAPGPTAVYEMSFIRSMAMHHDMAISMSKLCLNRATHAEVLSLCQDIVSAQTAEIAKLRAYAQDWSMASHNDAADMTRPDQAASTQTTTMDLQMEHSMMKMDELAAVSGPVFDKMFLLDMIEHHQSAVDMSKECGTRAHHAELTSLCRGIITEQTNEITQMRTWLKGWYGEQALTAS